MSGNRSVGGVAGEGGAAREPGVGASGPAIVLAIDTATSRTVIALGDLAGRPLAEEAWTAGHRHGEELLPHLQALLAANGLSLDDVAAIVVGTGPGAFTGLRVGLATAKALGIGLGRPLIGVATSAALLAGRCGR